MSLAFEVSVCWRLLKHLAPRSLNSDFDAVCSGRGRGPGRGRGGGNRHFNAQDGQETQVDGHAYAPAPGGSESSEPADFRVAKQYRAAPQPTDQTTGFEPSDAKAMMRGRWEAVQHNPGTIRHTKAAPVKTAWGNGSASSLLRKFDFTAEVIERAKTST